MHFLIVDEHPLVVKGYTSLLTADPKFMNLNIHSADNSKMAYESIYDAISKHVIYDLILIDLDIVSSRLSPVSSGKQLVLWIKKLMPETKIILTTRNNEYLLVYDIWKVLQPDGFAVKMDLNTNSTIDMIYQVLNGFIYKSPFVEECICKIWENETLVEDYNRKIIYFLNMGYKTLEIQALMSISQSAIQKRIVKMNKAFGVVDKNGLLKEIKRLGYL